MAETTLAPFSPELVARCAALVAAGHARRANGCGAAARFASPEACAELLARQPLQGFVSMAGSGVQGFLAGRHDGTFGFVPAVGYAVRDGADVLETSAWLYAALADAWCRDGVNVHDIEVAADPEVEQAWFTLGFGRRTCLGFRATSARDAEGGPSSRAAAGRTDVEVVVAGSGELDTIAELSMHEVEYRAATPVFAQAVGTGPSQVRALHEKLVDEGGVHLLARVAGDAVGLITLEPTSPSPLLTGEAVPFVGPTSVRPDVRGRGVGRALVAAALAWCRERGFEWVGVSFNTANLLSRRFWTRAGFQPGGWKLARRLPPGP
jgi:GNAT superfamily N-acetyltransferase